MKQKSYIASFSSWCWCWTRDETIVYCFMFAGLYCTPSTSKLERSIRFTFGPQNSHPSANIRYFKRSLMLFWLFSNTSMSVCTFYRWVAPSTLMRLWVWVCICALYRKVLAQQRLLLPLPAHIGRNRAECAQQFAPALRCALYLSGFMLYLYFINCFRKYRITGRRLWNPIRSYRSPTLDGAFSYFLRSRKDFSLFHCCWNMKHAVSLAKSMNFSTENSRARWTSATRTVIWPDPSII